MLLAACWTQFDLICSSLLSEAGFDEGSPFQKMRTTSITRDGGSGGAEEEARFTPHRLRLVPPHPTPIYLYRYVKTLK